MEKELKFSFDDINNLISYPLKNNNFSLSFNSIFFEQKQISEELSFFKTRKEIPYNFSFEGKGTANNLFITILLDGKLEYENQNNNKQNLNVLKNFSLIRYINECNLKINLDEKAFKAIDIKINKNFLEKNFPSLVEIYKNDFSSLPSATLKNQPSKNIHLARELFYSPFDKELENIYLQSKVLELIYNEFNELLNTKENKSSKIKLNEDDIEALHKIRELILFENDFSDLLSFSKKVRLNEFKIKYGFKQLFNTSVGQLILEQKMLYAKQLLESSEFSVQEISKFVGYKHQQNFSTAFIKFFGISPKTLMKNRTYYY